MRSPEQTASTLPLLAAPGAFLSSGRDAMTISSAQWSDTTRVYRSDSKCECEAVGPYLQRSRHSCWAQTSLASIGVELNGTCEARFTYTRLRIHGV